MASRIKVRKGRVTSRGRRRREISYLSREALRSLGGITDDQLRLWEFEELISHTTLLEIDGRREPVYTHGTPRPIRTIRSLGEDLGVNLPGIGVILHLLDQLNSR